MDPDTERIESSLHGSTGGVKALVILVPEAHYLVSDQGGGGHWPSSATFTALAKSLSGATPFFRISAAPPSVSASARRSSSATRNAAPPIPSWSRDGRAV